MLELHTVLARTLPAGTVVNTAIVTAPTNAKDNATHNPLARNANSINARMIDHSV